MEGLPIPSSSPNWRPATQPRSSFGTPQSNEKSSVRLPALGLDLDKIKKEAQEFELKHPTAVTASAPAPPHAHPPPLASPSSMYPGPPPPYSYPSSATSSAPGFQGYISPPDSRRLSDDDKDQQPSRQSLPSIHEALGKDQALLYSGPPPPSSVASQTPHTATAPNPSTPIPRSHPETVLSGPPNPYASSQHPSPYPSEPPDRRLHQPLRTSSVSEEQPPVSSRLPAHEVTTAPPQRTPNSPRAPTHQSPRTISTSQPPALFNPPSQPVQAVQAPQPLTSQQSFHNGPPAYPFPQTSANSTTYSHFPPSTPWRSDGFEIDRAEEVRKAASKQNHGNQPYGESVKRHLEIFDLETSLNEVCILIC